MTRRLHLLGRGNANEGEHQGERHADGIASGQTGTRKLGADGTALARQHLAGSVEAVEVTGELLGKVRQTERSAVASAAGDQVGKLVKLARKGELGRVGQQRVIDVLTDGLGGNGLHAHLVGLLRRYVSGTAQDGADASVSVLHVIDRVGVVALLNGLYVEVDHLVGALGDERVASGIGANLVDELLKGHHGALALGHTDGLAVTQQYYTYRDYYRTRK